MLRRVFAFSLILLAALSRLLPHAPNVAPITALALFSGVYLETKYAFTVPLAAMFISDLFLGFYSGMEWVYGSFLCIGFIGLWLRNHRGTGTTLGASVAGSILFFVVTNFGVWVSSQVTYTHTLSGLMECYAAGIPFFRNTLIGDLVYVGAMFGSFALARRYVPALAGDASVSRR